jgi:hypothetical protein
MKKKSNVFEPPECPEVTTDTLRVTAEWESEDNWKHRSAGMVCSTCMFFTPKTAKSGEVKLGRCRRHSPSMYGWPVMMLTDWCGDHKLDEEKI